jgi:hypothetical protein
MGLGLGSADGEVGVGGFAGSVDDAAHHGDAHGSVNVRQQPFDLAAEFYDINLSAGTGWTDYQFG